MADLKQRLSAAVAANWTRQRAFLDAHLQRAGSDAAQRRGEPHPVPVSAARIEADDQRRIADPVEQVIDIEGQVVAAGFLATLDHDDATRARDLLLLESQ